MSGEKLLKLRALPEKYRKILEPYGYYDGVEVLVREVDGTYIARIEDLPEHTISKDLFDEMMKADSSSDGQVDLRLSEVEQQILDWVISDESRSLHDEAIAYGEGPWPCTYDEYMDFFKRFWYPEGKPNFKLFHYDGRDESFGSYKCAIVYKGIKLIMDVDQGSSLIIHRPSNDFERCLIPEQLEWRDEN